MSQKKLFLSFALFGAVALVFSVGVFITSVSAYHSWGNYHWAHTVNPLTLKLGDNVSSQWDAYLTTTSIDWSESSVLDTTIVSGGTNPKNCKAVSGKVEVCNSKYGNNGWLGIANIWVSGDHITKGTVRVNDTYFNTVKYNTPAWRNLVMCQEVGHTLGLDHQDENFSNQNLGTCMDYTSNPSTNQHPNQHDYDQLATIYAHIDNISTAFISGGDTGGRGDHGRGKSESVGQDIDLNDPSAWGHAVRQDAQGRTSLYMRDIGQGEKIFTFVIWAQ